MLVKACGLRNLREIHWAHELGYDLFGIVVEPKSKRYVPSWELAQMWPEIPCRNRCVLVARRWQNLAVSSRLCREALLQCCEPYPRFIPPERRFMPIDGEEHWHFCRARQNAAYYLYDAGWYGLPDWCHNKAQLFVGGGLNRASLQELAARKRGCHYFGFDLSSGLENPDDEAGRKDYYKMRECLEIIRNNFLES